MLSADHLRLFVQGERRNTSRTLGDRSFLLNRSARTDQRRTGLLSIRNSNPKGIESMSPGLRGTSYPG
jgi:hypothetical protein